MSNTIELSEKEFLLFCFLHNITDESEKEVHRPTVPAHSIIHSWDNLMSIVRKIESETSETVRIDGDTVEIYGSIDPPIIISDLEIDKRTLLFEALFLYVQKRS